MKSMVFAVVVAATGWCASAEQTVDALKAETPPAIDGALDDAVWQSGEWYTGFRLLNKPETRVGVQTRFKVAADGSAVYFAVRGDEPDMGHQVKTVTDRDGKVFHDECIEVMLGADPDGSRYLHLIVNPLGTLYDAEVFNEGNETNVDWDGAIDVGVATEAEAWSLELRVPLVDIGAGAGGAEGWIVNVSRERHAGEVSELSSFAPLTGGFHQPSHYASLRLPDVDLSRFLWGVRYPYGIQCQPEQGAVVCSAKTHIENRTGAFRFFLLRPTWRIRGRDFVGRDVAGGLDDGQSREVGFSFPVADEGRGMLVVEVLDRRNPDVLWAVRKRSLDLSYVPITIDVRRPHYRNAIYATESLSAIEATVKLAVSPAQRAGAELGVALAPGDRAGESISERVIEAGDAGVDVTLPIPALEAGSYVLAVELRRGGEVVERAETAIRKLGRVAHEWRLDEDNVLLHNGEPFLPFGWFSMPPERMAAPDCAYTAAQDYNAQWRSVEENLARLDAFAAAGKVVTIYPYPNAKMVETPAWGRPLTDEEAAALRERVRSLKDHPGLFAWYMADEPELRPALVERVRQIYDVVADEDPFHPCIMLNDTISGIYKYACGGDVLMPDPYPCFLDDGVAAVPLEKVTKFMETCNEAAKGRKALWITPQAFNYGDYGRENNRAPTFAELRNMTYQAVIQGTTGFLYYTWAHSQNYMGVQRGMPFLAREIADLEAAILAPDAGDRVEVQAPAPEHVHYAVRRVGDALYLFAVNTATEPQEVRFRLEEIAPDTRRLQVVSEARFVEVDENGAFQDQFARYGTHVYTTDAGVAERETVAAAQAEIDKLDAARKRPGNLAFEDNGTTVSVSSKSRYGSSPARLIDGVRDGMGWRDGTPGEWPDWVELAWREPVEVGRVVVFSDTVADAAVLVSGGDSRQAVAEEKAITGGRATLSFDRLRTDRLRVEVHGNREGQKNTWVTEIEAYAE